MKGKDRKAEDEAKQTCFMSALQHVRSNTTFRKMTQIARQLTGQESGEEFARMLNLFYSIKNGRSTPPDYLAQQLYDNFPSQELLDILSLQFPVTAEQAETQQEVPIEEELPEILLARIRQLKSEREEWKQQVEELEKERDKLVSELEEILNDPERPTDSALKKLLDMLREASLIL